MDNSGKEKNRNERIGAGAIAQVSHPSNELTQSVRQTLRGFVHEDRFDLWFSESDSIVVSKQLAHVFSDSSFGLQRIQNSFGIEIRDAVTAVCGADCQIDFCVREAKSEASAVDSDAANSCDGNSGRANSGSPLKLVSSEEQSSADSGSSAGNSRRTRKAKLGLVQFCFGETNRLAETASQQILTHPGQFSPLLVYGPSGCGKSLLLDSVTTEFRRRLKFGRCVMITAEQFTSNFVGSLRGSGIAMFRRKYRDLDLLAIDDIHFLSGKQATMVEMQYTIDHLIREGKQVIISSDRPPLELSQLGTELCARLTGGLICPLQYPDEESRFEILNRMCKQRGFAIPPAVLRYVASKVSRDVRRLSGAINKIHAMSICSDRKMTVEYASEVLSDLISITSHAASMAQIERAVCEVCGISAGDLKSESRAKRISSARMLAMWLSREYTSNAYSEIGSFFGGRTHSTVIAAGKRVRKWIGEDTRINLASAQISTRDVIQRIESRLGVG